MWADEKLLALKPNESEYQDRLAGTRYNIGLHLSYAQESSRRHSSCYEQALPVAAKSAALDPDDVRAQYTLALYQTRLASRCSRRGASRKRGCCSSTATGSSTEVFKRDNSLRTQYALGVNAVRLGELYAHLAEKSRAGRRAQLDLGRQARDSLQRGVASLRNVTAHATLTSGDMIDVSEGVALLARVDATLERSEMGTFLISLS